IVGAMSDWKYPERIGQPVCRYYMRFALCKFGSACKYHHPRQGTESSSPATTTTTYPIPLKQGMGFGSYSPVALNVLGYPLRPTTTIVPSTALAPTVLSGQLLPMHSAIYQNVQLPVISSQPYG
ncbi:zinc finger CCCH domain-containing protein 34-like protein, partial [Tanacetum coccineum]